MWGKHRHSWWDDHGHQVRRTLRGNFIISVDGSACVFQIGSITGAVLIVLIAVVGGILYQSAWIIAPKLWIVGTIFPVAGYSLGFLLARIAGQPWHRYDI